MIRLRFKFLLLFVIILIIFGCSLKAYMGMHGKSIKQYPEIHEDVSQDSECLECHHPDNADALPTPHPNFKGCIKCHNDDIRPDKQ